MRHLHVTLDLSDFPVHLRLPPRGSCCCFPRPEWLDLFLVFRTPSGFASLFPRAGDTQKPLFLSNICPSHASYIGRFPSGLGVPVYLLRDGIFPAYKPHQLLFRFVRFFFPQTTVLCVSLVFVGGDLYVSTLFTLL